MRSHISFFAIVAILFSFIQPIASASATSLAPITPSWNTNDELWIGASATWQYPGYSVAQYQTGTLINSMIDQIPADQFTDSQLTYARTERLSHPLGGSSLRNQGFLPLTDTFTNVYLYSFVEHKIVATDYKFPTTRWCESCSTSPGVGTKSLVQIKDGQLLVTDGDFNWYLLNPYTLQATVVVTADTLEQKTGARYAWLRVINNHIVSVSGPASNLVAAGFEIVSPTDVVRTNLTGSFSEPSVYSVSDQYVIVTDQANEMFTGQIDEGVYVSQGSTLTKIGFTAREQNSNNPVTLHEPRFISSQEVAWIGADNNLYVADITTAPMQHTGVLDTPRGVPFRSMSDPKVYYHDALPVYPFTPHAYTYEFTTEADYFDVMNTQNFQEVLYLPDTAVDHIKLHYEVLTQGQQVDIRRTIYANKH